MPSTQNFSPEFDPHAWVEEQLQRYGPVLGGDDLRTFLGYRTAAALAKARYLGLVGVPLFSIPGRKGKFAMTSEACSWLLALRRSRDAKED